MEVWRDTPGNRGRAHTHTAEEIIAVVRGSISLGAVGLPVGHAVHIPAGTRYAVTSGPDGHAFLNFRAGPSRQRYAGEDVDLEETARARGGRSVDDVIGW